MTGKATLRRRSVRLPNPKAAVKMIKKGRLTLGGIFELSDGSRNFIAYMWRDGMYLGKQPTVSSAVAAGEAGWAIDTDLLRSLRRDGVSRICVFLRDNADMYITPIENYFKDGEHEQVPWSRMHRQARRSVNLSKFSYLQKPVKV